MDGNQHPHQTQKSSTAPPPLATNPAVSGPASTKSLNPTTQHLATNGHTASLFPSSIPPFPPPPMFLNLLSQNKPTTTTAQNQQSQQPSTRLSVQSSPSRATANTASASVSTPQQMPLPAFPIPLFPFLAVPPAFVQTASAPMKMPISATPQIHSTGSGTPQRTLPLPLATSNTPIARQPMPPARANVNTGATIAPMPFLNTLPVFPTGAASPTKQPTATTTTAINSTTTQMKKRKRTAAEDSLSDGNTATAAAMVMETEPKSVPTSEVKSTHCCSCKKSECLKRYCECFINSVRCSDQCRCVDCKNFEGSSDLLQLSDKNYVASTTTEGTDTIKYLRQQRQQHLQPRFEGPLIGKQTIQNLANEFFSLASRQEQWLTDNWQRLITQHRKPLADNTHNIDSPISSDRQQSQPTDNTDSSPAKRQRIASANFSQQMSPKTKSLLCEEDDDDEQQQQHIDSKANSGNLIVQLLLPPPPVPTPMLSHSHSHSSSPTVLPVGGGVSTNSKVFDNELKVEQERIVLLQFKSFLEQFLTQHSSRASMEAEGVESTSTPEATTTMQKPQSDGSLDLSS